MLANWLHSLDPSLTKHLEDEGITLEWVEQKACELCCSSLAYRHRLANVDKVEMSLPRFHLRIDAKC